MIAHDEFDQALPETSLLPPEETRRPSKAWWNAVVLAVIVGVAARSAVVLVFPDMALHGDETEFVTGARELLAGEDVSCIPFRPPLYIWLCAAALSSGGDEPDAIRFVQIGLEATAILGIALLGIATLGRRAGAWAAWLYALYPDYITYSHYLWSETLAIVLILWGLLALVRMHGRPSWRTAVVTGVVWGLGMHVKPFLLYMLPLLLVWIVLAGRRELRRSRLVASALTVIVAALAIVPWSVHVSRAEDQGILICKTGGKNLSSGVNYAPPPQYDLGSAWREEALKGRRYHQREVGVVQFLAANPGLYLTRSVEKMTYLWSPNSYQIRYLYEGFEPGVSTKYGHPGKLSRAVRMAVVWGTLGFNMLLTVGLIVGVFRSRERLLRGLALVFVPTYMAMITLTPALSRYRLPLMLFALLYSGLVLAGGRGLLRLEGRNGRVIGLVACLAFVGFLWYRRLPGILETVW